MTVPGVSFCPSNFFSIEVLAIKEFWVDAGFRSGLRHFLTGQGYDARAGPRLLPNGNVMEPRIEKRLQALRACRLIIRPTRFPL